ncbi:unnamed protein product [Closterium sp. NIES-65]|nr:unnamed protein product [Closterium sp. NIES-65]
MRCPPAFLPRQNAEALLSLGALQLLLPLAQDSMASVRSAATLSLGRLANVSHTWSHHLVQHNVLPSLCKALTGTNRHHKRAAAYLVKAVSRHAGAELAEAGVLPLLTECLLDAMLAVRETAACALGHVAKHSGDLAMRVVETGAVRLLVTCLQDEAVARIALSVLTDVARHSLLHATAVADAGGITAAVSLLGSPDVKTRRQVCVCLSTIARHSESLALQVLDQPGASRLLLCLHDSSPSLRASAAAAVREVARQGPAAAGRLVGMGGIGPLLDAVGTWRDEGEGEGMTKGSAKVSGQGISSSDGEERAAAGRLVGMGGIGLLLDAVGTWRDAGEGEGAGEGKGMTRGSVVVALGFLAASSPDAALAVVASDGISPLQDLIVEGDADVTLKGACAWALSQMASHGPNHANPVAGSGVRAAIVTASTVPTMPIPWQAVDPNHANPVAGSGVRAAIVTASTVPTMPIPWQAVDPNHANPVAGSGVRAAIVTASTVPTMPIPWQAVDPNHANPVAGSGVRAAIVTASTVPTMPIPWQAVDPNHANPVAGSGVRAAIVTASTVPTMPIPWQAVDPNHANPVAGSGVRAAIVTASTVPTMPIPWQAVDPSHAKAVADSGVLIDMVTAATVHLPAPEPVAGPAAAAMVDGAEARKRLVQAVKDVVVRVNDIEALDALLQWTKLPDGILESVLHRMSVVLAKDNACRPAFLASNGFTRLQRLLQLAEAKRAAAAADAAANAATAAAAADSANAESPGDRAAKVTRFDPASVRCIEGGVDWDLVEDHVSSINSLFPFEVSRFYSADYQQHLLQKLSDSVKPEWAAIATAAASPRAMSIKAREGRFVRGGRRPVDVEEVGRGGWEAPDLGPVMEEEGEGQEDGGEEEEGGEEVEGEMGEGGTGGEGESDGEGGWGGDGDGGVQLMQGSGAGKEKRDNAAVEVVTGSTPHEVGGGGGGVEHTGVEDCGSRVQKHHSVLTSDEGCGAGEERRADAAMNVGKGSTRHEVVDGGGEVVERVGMGDGEGVLKDGGSGEAKDGNGGMLLKDGNEGMTVDIISAIEFDRSGEHLATGDRGGRVVLFDRIDLRDARGRREMEASDYPPAAHQQIDYRYSTEFQSHEPEFDYLKSLEIEEKINKIRWVNSSQGALYVLSTNDKTIKLWRVTERRVKAVSQFNCPPRTAADYLASANAPADPAAADALPTPPVSVPGGPQINPRYLPRPGSLSAASATARAVAAGAGAVLNGVGEGMELDFPPGGFPQLRLPAVVSTNETTLVARCRRVFSNAHAYHINSISCNSDRETFISADDLRVNLWNLENNSQSFNVVDIKPANMEDLTEVITCAEFHPSHCHSLAYSTSKGTIRLIDMRQSALCDQHSKLFEEQEPPGNRSFFSEIIASISDVKFSNDGRYIFSRDYMTVKLWDIHMEAQPLGTFKVHEFLRPKLCDLYENDCIFDKFECTPSGDGLRCASGSYSNLFRVFGVVPGSDEASLLESSKTPNSPSIGRPRSLELSDFSRVVMAEAVDSMDPNGMQHDFSSKLLHLAWHPKANLIACAASNSLYMYYA